MRACRAARSGHGAGGRGIVRVCDDARARGCVALVLVVIDPTHDAVGEPPRAPRGFARGRVTGEETYLADEKYYMLYM